jgi:hypothetical protein
MRRATRPTAALLAAVLAAGLAGAPRRARAGAWTRDEGHFYVNTSYLRIATRRYFAPDFSVVDINPYEQHVVSLYGEVGLITRWLTGTLEGTLYRRNRLVNQGYTEGVGDFRVGLWTGLVTSPVRLSFGLTLGIPTGDAEPRAPGGDEVAQQTARLLPTGDGEWDVEGRLALGYAFGGVRRWPPRHYVVAEAGYWLRTNRFADAFVYRLELGTQLPWRVVDRFWLALHLVGVESFASQRQASLAFSGLGNGVTYTAYGAELSAAIWRGLGALLGVDSAFRARSLAAGAQLKVGVSYQW